MEENIGGYRFDDVILDIQNRQILRGGKVLPLNTKYFDDTIRPDILCVWDINAASGFVIPKVHWEPTYDWHFEIGAIYIWADNPVSGPFGYVQDSDLLYGVIEYKF